MLSVRSNEDACLPAISSQRKPLSPEEEAQLEWLFCLASSLERIRISLAQTEPEQAHVDRLVVLARDPSLKPTTVVFRAA
jgi:hypothetical protein